MDKPAIPQFASRLDAAYVHLRDDASAVPVDVTETFWDELTSGQRPELDAGRLVMKFEFDCAWPTWECHPAGEELGVLVTGSAELVLDVDGAERVIELRVPGDYVLIPRGVWHTARTSEPTAMLFVTPGRGTAHRPAQR